MSVQGTKWLLPKWERLRELYVRRRGALWVVIGMPGEFRSRKEAIRAARKKYGLDC